MKVLQRLRQRLTLPKATISIALLIYWFQSAGLKIVLMLERLLYLLSVVVAQCRDLIRLLLTPIRVILAVPLVKSLQCLWLVSTFSLYIAVNAGFAYGGYRIAEYSMYLAVWSGAIACALFTTIVLYFSLQVAQQIKR